VSARQAQPTQPSTTKQIQEKPNETKQKSLDLFGFIRPNRGAFQGATGNPNKKILSPVSGCVQDAPSAFLSFFLLGNHLPSVGSVPNTYSMWSGFTQGVAKSDWDRRLLQSRSNPTNPSTTPKIEPRAPVGARRAAKK
jgi:hypothetical protein